MKKFLTYVGVFIAAVCLTLASNRIERDLNGTGWGFPFLNAIARPAFLHDNSNPVGFLANIVVYSVILLTAVRVIQTVYAHPPQLQPSLYFLLPATGVAAMFFVGAGFGYNPFPMTGYREITPTPTPEHVEALMRQWVGVDTTTGETLALQFGGYEMSLRAFDTEFRGMYTWITPERITIRLGRYIEVDQDTVSRPCPMLPTVFNAPCEQEPGRGYPFPIIPTPIIPTPITSTTSAASYPEPPQTIPQPPLPTVVERYGLYQGVEAEYQIVVNRTELTLTAPTGEVQVFNSAR